MYKNNNLSALGQLPLVTRYQSLEIHPRHTHESQTFNILTHNNSGPKVILSWGFQSLIKKQIYESKARFKPFPLLGGERGR